MGWLLFSVLSVASIQVFMRVYRQRLDALEGPWIARAIVQDQGLEGLTRAGRLRVQSFLTKLE
jgi:hypothetical protein